MTLSPADKEKFFEGKSNVMNTMHWHLDTQSDKLTLRMRSSIVETIIGELFFRDEDSLAEGDGSDEEAASSEALQRAVTKKKKEKESAMKLFVKEEMADEYVVSIRNTTRFHLAMDHISTGMSFRQAALAIQHAKGRLKAAKLLGVTDYLVGQYVRVLVGASLQQIASMLGDGSVWAFSLAADGSTHRGQPFVDQRVRLCYRGSLLNLHLVALPTFERHTSQNLFEMIVKFMDALFPEWRSKLIGVASDGENVMTGRHAGVVTRIAACATHRILRVWCAPHQIDIVVKSTAEDITGGEWVQKVYSLSIFLRAQANLIIGMGVKCPKKTNRWTHLGRALTFYKTYRRKIVEYIEEQQRDAHMPTDAWWVITYAVSPAIDLVNDTFTVLQGKSLLIHQQEEHIQVLVGSLSTLFGVESIDPNAVAEEEEDGGEEDEDEVSKFISHGGMRIHCGEIISHIRDQGSFAGSCLDRLTVAERKNVLQEIGMYAINLVTGLSRVRAERGDDNEPLDDGSVPVLPVHLVNVRPSAFIKEVLDPYRSHVAMFWSAEKIEEVENEQRNLRSLYESDASARKAIDATTTNTTFDDAWNALSSRFSTLRAFCGGLASVFANTASVEGDFSILKWEMDEFRSSLTHLSLEGIFQAKQRSLLGLGY